MAAITEDYVGFETANLLKEKGFNEPCRYYYSSNGKIYRIYGLKDRNYTGINTFSAPSQALVMKWLRKVHNIDIIAPPQFDGEKWTYSSIIIKLIIPTTEIRLNNNRTTKETACETAIKYCLEHLI